MRTPPAARAPSESERSRTVLFALFVCLIVFLSEEASYKEDLERKRLRTVQNNQHHIAVPSDVALNIFSNRINGTFSQNVEITNVYVGEWAPLDDINKAFPGMNAPFDSGDENSVTVFAVRHDNTNSESESKLKEQWVEDPEKVQEHIVSGNKVVDNTIVDHSLRWNIESSIQTTLNGVHRVKGTLWTKHGQIGLEGIHLVRQGKLTIFSKHPSETREKILGLMTAVPPSMGIGANTTKHVFNSTEPVVLRGSFGGSAGVAFGEPVAFDSESVSSHPSTSNWLQEGGHEDTDLFEGCSHPIRFELDVTSEIPIDDSKKTKALSFQGVGFCKNTSIRFLVPTTPSLMLNIDQAVRSASFMSLYAIVETIRVGHVMTLLGPLRTGILADLGPLSMGTFGLVALTDMYLCELLMNMSGVGGDGWWITASIFKGGQFLFSHIPLLVLIFFGRSRLNAEPSEVVVRSLSSCMSRAQVAWLLSMFLFEFLRQKFPRGFALLWMSFWVPQIYCTATMNMAMPISLKDAINLTILRVVWPLVALSTHILDTLAAADRYGSHQDSQIYDPLGVLLVLAWSGIQILIIYLQQVLGPQFFIPKILLPKKFDYRAGNRDLKEGEECVVCMQSVSPEEMVTTPCDHVFHEKCLGPWLQVKRSCPTCRAALPPM